MQGPPQYRINLVAELTGVSEATLRAWERRYAMPKPERTPSGYRIYTPVDVDQVRRMRELCESGIAPREAAQMVAQGVTEGVAQSSGAAEGEPPRSAAARTLEATELRFMELVLPTHLNERNTLHVGIAMLWMEKAAIVVVARALRQRVDIVSSECVDCRVALSADTAVEITAHIDATRDGTTTAIAEVLAEDLVSGARVLALRARFYVRPAPEGAPPEESGAP